MSTLCPGVGVSAHSSGLRSTRGTYKALSGLRPRCPRPPPARAPRGPAAGPWFEGGQGPRDLLGWEAGGRQGPESPSELGNLKQEQKVIRACLGPKEDDLLERPALQGLRLSSQH